MDEFVKALYKVMRHRTQYNKSETQNLKRYAIYVRDLFNHDEAVDFLESCLLVRGTYLYGEFMKEKVRRIMDKTNTSVGITF